MNLRTFFAYDPTDTDEIRLEKFAAFLVAGSCSLAGIIWSAMYYLIFGWGLTAFLPFSFTIIVGSVLIISHITKKHTIAIYAQIICIIYITALIQWSIGDIFDSGVVMVWAFLGPICALMFFSIRQSIIWFVLYLINLMITVVFNDFFTASGQVVTENIRLLFFSMNIGVSSTVVFIFASYYVNVAIKAHKRTNKLLQTNLQQEIALRQNEKLATLGKLSAGVAHELNNPAAAAQRGTDYLRDAIIKLENLSISSSRLNFEDGQANLLTRETNLIMERAKSPLDIEPLTRSDYEYEIENWLTQHNIEDAWDIAPLLTSIGYSCDQLAEIARHFTDEQFSSLVHILAYRYRTFSIIEEIGHGTGRISEIVKALKSYSYMDQAPSQSVDIHNGLDNTLIMLGSKLKSGVDVRREYADKLPKIEAFGSELNQVWTNLIDNAISAMDGKGEIHIKTYPTKACVVVEITDNGPGIPSDIQQKIFDPFFTTKAPGEGTGLGLNISYNIIVQKHRGYIGVESKAGETRFTVKLPLNYEDPNLDL